MANIHNPNLRYGDQMPQNPSVISNSGCGGVCMMSNSWRDQQHPSFINFISSFLSANSFRLNFVAIAPDFIFNCGGLSVAFIFLTNWDCNNSSSIFSRVQKLKEQFAYLYVVGTLPTEDQIDYFVRSWSKYEIDLRKPIFVQVLDLEMGFEKIVNIAQARGVCKQQDAVSKLRAERERSVQGIGVFLKVISSIPSIDNHDANSLYQAIGSIEEISKASKECILESSDLSADKAEVIYRFFRDPKFYLSTKIHKEKS